MAENTKIQWVKNADGTQGDTWNFLRGCRRVSEGCRNCYAEKIAARFSGPGMPYELLAGRASNGEARWTGQVSFYEDILLKPLKRRRPTTYFVNSMSDLFYETVRDEWIDKAVAVMALTPQHTYQILTKRPERMLKYFADMQNVEMADYLEGSPFAPAVSRVMRALLRLADDSQIKTLLQSGRSPPPSAGSRSSRCSGRSICGTSGGAYQDGNNSPFRKEWLDGIDWAVIGGESGTGARPFNVEWEREIVSECKSANVPVFVKQLGRNPIQITPGINTFANPQIFAFEFNDRKGGDMAEWPKDLQIREMPQVSQV